MTQRTPRLQLWKEESAILAGFAAEVRAGGTIVEIGTAEGATAQLMRDAAKPGVEIYTVDIAPSRIARESLAGSNVHVVGKASTAFAAEWPAAAGRPIDFLFIDGNHDLVHVVSDWNAWTPHVSAGARVAFHDFDPPQRGGLAHFAVRVCGETVRRLNRLSDAGHDYKMLHGRVAAPGQSAISADECLDTLDGIAANVREVLAASPAIDSERAQALDSVTFCYLVEQALTRSYPDLLERAGSHAEFLVWGETLQMLEHGLDGQARFPFNLPRRGASLDELSSFVAREQVRLVLLARLAALVVSRPL